MRILYFTKDYTTHDHRFLTSLAESGNEVFSLRLERRGVQKEDRPLPPQVEQICWRGGQGPVTWRDYPALLLDLAHDQLCGRGKLDRRAAARLGARRLHEHLHQQRIGRLGGQRQAVGQHLDFGRGERRRAQRGTQRFLR